MFRMLVAFSLLISSLAYAAAAKKPGPPSPPVLSTERMILHTNLGDIVVGFYPSVAPKHVAQILKLARAGIFDGVAFYRLQKGFVMQIDNYDIRKTPLTAAQKAIVTKIPDEFSSLKHRRGILSMAKFDEPNSAEASFSIVLGDAPHLDGYYTIFGEVTNGMDVVSEIEKLPVGGPEGIRTQVEVVVTRADVVDASQLDVSKLRGVQQTAMPTPEERMVFMIIAATMFISITATPFVKTILAQRRAAKAAGA